LAKEVIRNKKGQEREKDLATNVAFSTIGFKKKQDTRKRGPLLERGLVKIEEHNDGQHFG